MVVTHVFALRDVAWPPGSCGTFRAAMGLILQTQTVGDVLVVRCQGRIVSGDEVRPLQLEVEKLAQTQLRKKVVLHLEGVDYVDSGGLGTLIRLRGVLRAESGDLKLCQLSPVVRQVLEVTNLLRVFHTFASESEAIEAFSERPRSPEETFQPSRTRVVCLDNSSDLLSYLSALLKRSGYEVFTARSPSDAMTLVKATGTRVVILGPGMSTNDSALEKFNQGAPNVQLLLLPSNFSTAEASQAGTELIDRVRSLVTELQ